MAWSDLTLGVASDCVDAFATSALYNGTDTISGIFDNGYLLSEGGVESSDPTFACLVSSVPAVAHGSTMVINSVNYTVSGIEPDGQGMVVLQLSEA